MDESWSAKKSKQIGERDGFCCHYCGYPLAFPIKRVVGWKHYDDFWNDGYNDLRPGDYPIYEFEQPENTKYPTIDHKIPKSQGGTNDMDNLVLSCIDCNIQKGARHTYEAFLEMKAGENQVQLL